MKIILLISFLLTINLTSFEKPQENETDEKIILSELLVENEQLVSILDSLTITEKKCSYYDSLMVWVISFSKIDHSQFLMKIEIIKRLNRLHRSTPHLFGYFYHNRILFIAKNQHIDDVFVITDKKNEFVYKKQMPRPERYSMWHFYYEKGEFILKDYWPIDLDCQ